MTATPEPKITNPWIEDVFMRSKNDTPRTKSAISNMTLDLLYLSEYATTTARAIPKKEEMKFGFPKVPSIAPYVFCQPIKSPKMTTQTEYKTFTAKATMKAFKILSAVSG